MISNMLLNNDSIIDRTFFYVIIFYHIKKYMKVFYKIKLKVILNIISIEIIFINTNYSFRTWHIILKFKYNDRV